MGRFDFRFWIAATALAAAPLAVAATTLSSPTSSPGWGQDEGPLLPHMKALNGGQRALKRLIVDPQTNERALLDQISAMQGAALAILTLPPPEPKPEVKADARLWSNAFRRSMADVYVLLLELERATLEGDVAALATGYERLGALKKSGHEAFRD